MPFTMLPQASWANLAGVRSGQKAHKLETHLGRCRIAHLRQNAERRLRSSLLLKTL